MKAETEPRSFKLTVGSEGARFNHNVQADTMSLNGRVLFHLVDESTHYTGACFLLSQFARDILKAMKNLWVLSYVGSPDYVTVNQGSAYISAQMMSNMVASGITLSEAPIESPGSIGLFERYHVSLRTA